MKKVMLILVGVLVFTGHVLAGTQAGMREVQVQGSIDRDGNSENDNQQFTVSGQVGYNYFLSPNVSIGGVTFVSSRMDIPEEGDDTTSQSVFAMMRLSLYLGGGSSEVVPYIGGQGGAAFYAVQNENYDDSSTSVAYGGFGGFKIFASENTSWNLEASHVIYQPDVEDNEEEVTFNTTSFSVGFSYFF